MNIEKIQDRDKLAIRLDGRLDTVTAPQLEESLSDCIDNSKEVVFDLSKLEYISSAGLRILLSAQKKMNDHGTMLVKNTQDSVMEIFEVTGFVDILNIV
jgi:anti-sigma B factor antagonist